MCRHINPVIHPIEAIGLVGRPFTIGYQGCAIDRTIVAIPTFIIGISIKRIVGQEPGIKVQLTREFLPNGVVGGIVWESIPSMGQNSLPKGLRMVGIGC